MADDTELTGRAAARLQVPPLLLDLLSPVFECSHEVFTSSSEPQALVLGGEFTSVSCEPYLIFMKGREECSNECVLLAKKTPKQLKSDQVLGLECLVKLPAGRARFKKHVFANQQLHNNPERREEEAGGCA